MPSLCRVVRIFALLVGLVTAASNDIISVLKAIPDITAAVGYLQSRAELVDKLNAGKFTGTASRVVTFGCANSQQS
jgi:hypothetical protein